MLNLAFISIILIFLVLRFSVTLFNFLSNPKLGKYGRHFTDKVSVIIQVTEESTELSDTLNAFMNQDYQEIEVIVTQSLKSKTSPELKALCAADPRFHIKKRNAINTDDASGDYLLFLEPGVVVRNGLINSLIYRTKVFNLSLVNIIPTQAMSGMLSHLLVPLNNFLLLNLTPLRLVRLFSSAVFSAGGSECMFFDAAVYKTYNWQQKIEGDIPEPVEVMRNVKQEGFKVETLLGYRLISVPAPEKNKGLLSKTGEQLLKAFGNNLFAALLYVLLVVTGPLVMLLNYEYTLLILPVGLIFLTRIMISFLSGQNPVWNVLLHPFQMIFLFFAMITGIYQRLMLRLSNKR